PKSGFALGKHVRARDRPTAVHRIAFRIKKTYAAVDNQRRRPRLFGYVEIEPAGNGRQAQTFWRIEHHGRVFGPTIRVSEERSRVHKPRLITAYEDCLLTL